MKQLQATIFLKEIQTDGHSPMKFICSDHQVYYCKYRVNHKLEELDCLIYEVVCHHLLSSLAIPTPDIAIVELLEGTFSVRDLKKNRGFAKPGILTFGSKEIKNSNLVTGLELISDSRAVSTIYNPYDLVKIAVFDVWVNNTDRGKNENYNLLLSGYNDLLKFWAFDHAFAFGGINDLRIFNNQIRPDISGKLMNTRYWKSITAQLDLDKSVNIVDTLVNDFAKTEQVIAKAFEDIPQEWKVFGSLKPKIDSFLLDSQRIEQIRQLAISQLFQL
jgi:hypothetical protein